MLLFQDSPAEPIRVDADREALGLALWNLLDNAVKYSPDAPTIWVALRRDGDRIFIDVRDQGLGIAVDEQADVFRQFVRGTEAKSRRIRGTGIGLALVKHIARAHGGDVTVDSAPGRHTWRGGTDAESNLDSVSWMPDGRHVIIVRSKQLSPTPREALLVPVSGGAPKVLELPTTVSERIDVTADGKRLAFVAGERRQEVWLLENYLPAASTAAKK